MADSQSEKRVEQLKQRLHDELVDDEGNPPDPADVDDVVADKAAALSDAPVQEFVPLLVEHQARDELREQGLHRDLDDEDDGEVDAEAPQPSTDDDSEQRRQRLEWNATPHL